MDLGEDDPRELERKINQRVGSLLLLLIRRPWIG